MLREIDFESVRTEKKRIAVIYGVIAGIVYSLVTWGYDGFMLAQAHAFYPWTMFLLGIVPTTLVASLVAWVVYRSQNFLVAFLLWLVTGIVYAWLAGHIPFDVLSRAISILNPDLSRMVDYNFVIAARLSSGLATVLIVILTVVGGMLEISLVDATSDSPAPLGRWIPTILWVAIFFLAGLASENNLIEPLTKPVYTTSYVIQYAAQHEGQTIDHKTMLDLHLRSVEALKPVWRKPYRIALSGFDEMLFSVNLIVDFNGQWARCSVLDSFPSNCELVDKNQLYLAK